MKQGFIFTITDMGCFITFIKGGCIVTEGFFKNPDAINDSDIRSLLIKYYKSPVIVYLDTLNQTFFEEEIPPTNIINKNRIINQLKQEHKTQTNSVLCYKKTKEIYQFSTAQLSNDNALWFNYINHLENPLDSVRSLAIETRHFLRNVKETSPILIITHFHENIGLRQSVFISKQFSLSRLITIKSKDIKTAVAHETKNLIDYLKREEPGISDNDINIISMGDHQYFKALDPRIHSHLDAINIAQLSGVKKREGTYSFLSYFVQILCSKRPESAFKFDISKKKEQEEFLYILLNALTFSIMGFALIYLLGSVSSFSNFANNIPHLKQEIQNLEIKNSEFTKGYKSSFSESYQNTIEKIQAEINKQTEEIKNPLKQINILKKYMPNHWHIQKIEWGVQSPKYLEHSLLDKVLRHRNQPYFIMDIYLKFKGPYYQANDMFSALLQTPELQQFELQFKEKNKGLYVLRIIEREQA